MRRSNASSRWRSMVGGLVAIVAPISRSASAVFAGPTLDLVGRGALVSGRVGLGQFLVRRRTSLAGFGRQERHDLLHDRLGRGVGITVVDLERLADLHTHDGLLAAG